MVELIAYELVKLAKLFIRSVCSVSTVDIDELNVEYPVVAVIVTCPELDTVPFGSSGTTCADDDTTPLNLFWILL